MSVRLRIPRDAKLRLARLREVREGWGSLDVDAWIDSLRLIIEGLLPNVLPKDSRDNSGFAAVSPRASNQ